MSKKKVKFKQQIGQFLFGWLINWCYPCYFRPKYGYISIYRLIYYYFIPQKIFRLNGKVKWPVHFTSTIHNYEKITKGILCDPADSPNVYINAANGIAFGSNIEIGPGCVIVSANHDFSDFTVSKKTTPIIIGNNVWIGANCVILPSITIGNNVIIGAGSVVTKDIPSNSIACGNPCNIIKEKTPYQQNLSNILFNKNVPKEYLKFISQSC
ncbi:MAG: DapH/DapD/GlmU-related protein [Vicingaceae bacterium]|nr:DapH/DapD/GlmU-related protein [Vicingaceae bacterium]